LEELDQLCKDKSKILILDNASSPLGFKKSPGDPNKGKGLNEFGTACIGSMHHTKYLGFSEAGFAVVSSALYDEFNSLTNFGFSDDRKFNSYATNAKLSDVSAAFVLSHVENYAQESHQNFQKKYIDAISKIKGAEVFNLPDDSWSLVYGNMPVVFEKPVSHLVFRDVGIEANKYYKPLASLPRSQDLFDRIINLPLHSSLTNYEMDLILKKIEIEAK
jgi:dTDP-4-amino-4,6-dideoxygalactose transaminase